MKRTHAHGRTAIAAWLVSSTVASLLAAPDASAACVVAPPNVLTCTPPEAVIRDQPADPIDTIDLEDAAPVGLDLPEGLFFHHLAGPVADLTLTTSGDVTFSATNGPQADGLVQVLNLDGLNTVTLGVGSVLTATGASIARPNMPTWAMLANVSLGNTGTSLARSTTDFAGSLTLNAPGEADVQGIVTYVEGAGAEGAYTRLRSGASIEVIGGLSVGDGVRGATAASFAVNPGLNAILELESSSTMQVTGGGALGAAAESAFDVELHSAGDVTVTGVSGVQARAALFATTHFDGLASVDVTGGTLRVNQGSSTDTGPSYGIYAGADPGVVAVNSAATVRMSGALTGDGNGFTGIHGRARTDLNNAAPRITDRSVEIEVTGPIDVGGDGAVGIHGQTDDGLVDIWLHGSTLLNRGANGAAVLATTDSGTTEVDSQDATLTTLQDGTPGIRVVAATGSTLLRVRPGSVNTSGAAAHGVDIQTPQGNAFVTDPRGQIRTQGQNAEGVRVLNTAGFTALDTGAIETTGAGAAGIHVMGDLGVITVDSRGGDVTTSGDLSHGIWLETPDADTTFTLGNITVSGAGSNAVLMDTNRANLTAHSLGNLVASGAEGVGLWAYSYENDPARATVSLDLQGAITAAGRDGAAVVARSTYTSVDIGIGTTAALTGGWSPNAAPASALTLGKGVGLQFGSASGSTATIANAGRIGAASDRAIFAFADSGPATLTNTGNITGLLQLGPSADTVVNAAGGVIELRRFADEDGDGTRETERVAVSDFGTGDDVIRNETAATLRLGQAPAGTAIPEFHYLPDLMPVDGYALSVNGVEQAHLTRLELFENRGTISLREGAGVAAAGDVLLMTSGTLSAQGVLAAGAAPLVFVADGGAIEFDTELNEGGARSHSDMLVVDSVQLGPSGPTRVFVTNAGGMGAATNGAGIKLVDVLGGQALSAANAFVLGAPVVAGAFSYNLFRSTPLSADGDWYLRTAPAVNPPQPPVVPPPGTPPPPPPPPGPPPPTYRPEAALFSALPGFLRNIDAAVPGSRASRLGDETALGTARRGRAWARYVREDIETAQTGTVSPSVDGETNGFQLGVELYGGEEEAGAQIGLYAGHMEASASVSGTANGILDTPVGRLEPTATYAGVYVSRSKGHGFYFDALLQYGRYGGEALTFADGVVADIKGAGGYASLEGGYGMRVGTRLVVEPQFQLVAQPQRVHDVTILNAQVMQAPSNTLAGRAGLRIKGELGNLGWRFEPYVAASLWQGLDHNDRTRFSGNGATQTTLDTSSQLEALELAAGFSAAIGSRVLAFTEYSRMTSRGSSGIEREGSALSAGVRVAW